jgi:hypothetical protein
MVGHGKEAMMSEPHLIRLLVLILWGNKAQKGRKGGGRREKKRRRKKKKDSYIRIPKSNSAILFLGELSWPMDVKGVSFQTSPPGPKGCGGTVSWH